MKSLLIVLAAIFANFEIIHAKDTTIILKKRTRFSTLAGRYYGSVYFDTLVKAYNNRYGDYLNPCDTAIIPDFDSLFIKSKFAEIFSQEVKLVNKAATYQTTMYMYNIDMQKMGIDSISKNGKKGAFLINKAIGGIKAKCDSLKLPLPIKVISQLNSAAGDMSQYNHYLQGSDIFASKNIYMGNLHMTLWRMYAILWSMPPKSNGTDATTAK